jgi:CubicO group peptidase (beta-lactamase class C family)
VLKSVPLLFFFSVLTAAQDMSARFEQIIQHYVSNHQFMGSVLVAKGDETLLDRGYGSANLEWNVPNSPTGKFRLGSITKQFTAACILLLEERGKLNVQDAVKKYVPDAPPAWDKITIYHLLTHTSGIPNFTNFPDYRTSEAASSTPQQLVDRFKSKPLDFEPGTKWSYSNSGYVLLGYILEKVSGESYQRFLQENIFNPLGMKDSGYDSNSAVILHRVSGYTPSPDGIENAGYINMTIPFSAGGLYSTTEDMLRWHRALFGGKLLSSASLQKMTTPFKNDYAMGLMVETRNGRRVISHGGGIEGFNTAAAYWPDEKLSVIALANLNGQTPDEIANDIAAIVHGEQVTLPSERKETTLSAEALKPYLGVYEYQPGLNLTITRDGDHLVAQLTGQPQLRIYPESPTKFFWKEVDAQIEFAKDSSGKVTGATLHQGGRDVVLHRK